MSSSAVWSKGDEPVRVGSKVLCNYERRDYFKGILEPIGIVIGHDGSDIASKPWIVLTRTIITDGYDYNYFIEDDLKVLGNYDSVEGLWEAIEDMAPSPRHDLNLLLSETRNQFGKVHKELEK